MVSIPEENVQKSRCNTPIMINSMSSIASPLKLIVDVQEFFHNILRMVDIDICVKAFNEQVG